MVSPNDLFTEWNTFEGPYDINYFPNFNTKEYDQLGELDNLIENMTRERILDFYAKSTSYFEGLNLSQDFLIRFHSIFIECQKQQIDEGRIKEKLRQIKPELIEIRRMNGDGPMNDNSISMLDNPHKITSNEQEQIKMIKDRNVEEHAEIETKQRSKNDVSSSKKSECFSSVINNENISIYGKENLDYKNNKNVTKNENQNKTRNTATRNENQNKTENITLRNENQNKTRNTATRNENQNKTENITLRNENQNKTENITPRNENQNKTRNTATRNENQNKTRNTATRNENQNKTRNTATRNENQSKTRNTATRNENQNKPWSITHRNESKSTADINQSDISDELLKSLEGINNGIYKEKEAKIIIEMFEGITPWNNNAKLIFKLIKDKLIGRKSIPYQLVVEMKNFIKMKTD